MTAHPVNASVQTHPAALARGVGVAILFAIVVLSATFGGGVDSLLLARMYLAAALSVLLGAILSPKHGGLYLITSYFFALFVAVPALVQVEHARFPFDSIHTSVELNAGFQLVSIGHIAWTLGFGTQRSQLKETYTRLRSPVDRGWHQRQSGRALWISVLLVLAALAFAALAGPAELFTPRFAENKIVEDGFRAQFAHIARAFSLVGMLVSVMVLKATRRSKAPRFAKEVVFAAVGTALVVNYPPALPRFQLLGIALAVAMLCFDFYRPRVKFAFTSVATIFLLYLFAAIKDLRFGITLIGIGERDVLGYLMTADFDAFKQIVDGVTYYSVAPYRFGENFLGAGLFWIPRTYWVQKPIPTGHLVSAGLGYPYNNVSTPLPMEGYAAWGLGGTIIIMVLTGALSSSLEWNARSALGFAAITPWKVCYAVTVGYATILLRGSINAVAPMIFPALVVAVIVGVALPKFPTKHGTQPGEPREHVRDPTRSAHQSVGGA